MQDGTTQGCTNNAALPNVLYVGMGKSGSTLIYEVLLRHPDIFVSDDIKELSFFNNNKRWQAGLDWYTHAFRKYAGQRFVADISPGYHNKDVTRKRIAETLGRDVKIIFTLRHFTHFAYSRYIQKIRSRRVPHSFLHELETMGNFYRPLDDILAGYISTFGRENVLIMQYEKDFVRGAPMFEQRIYDFLGLDADARYYDDNADAKVNKGYVPRLVVSGPDGHEETRNGMLYRVPAHTLVSCNGYSNQNEYWRRPSSAMITENQQIAAQWTTEMSPDLYGYVQEKYTQPLARRISDKLGLDLDHWHGAPQRIAYDPAPLPDAYIVDPDGKTPVQRLWE